jgi:hypothetical protein
MNVRDWTIWTGPRWLELRCQRAVNCISQPEVVMRASVLRRVGAPRPELHHTSDIEMWLRMAAVADVGRVNGSDQGWYRVHAQSMQRTVNAGVLIDLQGRRDAFMSAFGGLAGRVPDSERMYASARRALAAEALDRACRAYDRGQTASVPVDELVAFAADVLPEAALLPQWQALERRRRVGARAHMLPPFIARALVRRACEEVRRWRWQQTGI